MSALRIERDYAKVDRDAAMLLANLRQSDLVLRLALSSAALECGNEPRSLAIRMRDLAKARETMLGELARAEAAYATWIATHTATTVEAFHHVFRLDELPTTEKLKADVSGQPAKTPSWWSLLTELRCAVSCDFEDQAPALGEIPSEPVEEVVYRVPRLATITHWSAEPDAESPSGWKVTEVLRERHKVVVVAKTERTIPLRPMRTRWMGKDKPIGDSDTGLTFDADGILTKISTKRTDPALERATTLAELPEHVKAGITAGKAVLKPFTPEGQTERLKAETDLINAKKALEKAQAPSADDPLASLKSEVEKAELEARRARAQTVLSDPTRSYVLVTVTPHLNHQGTEE